MNFKTLNIISITAAALLTGCGGGGSGSSAPANLTGQFIDSAVQGLTYACSSGNTGKTDELGNFTCKSGDTVTFSIGVREIGSAKASSIMTPYTLYPNNEEAAINLAQLLQTLDNDNDPSNGIELNERAYGYDLIQISMPELTNVNFDSLVNIGSKTLVDEATAKAHLDLSISNTEENPLTNTPDVSRMAVVTVMNGSTQSYCDSRSANNYEYDGYSDYKDFTSAGGTVEFMYLNGTHSCDSYANAGFCAEVDVSQYVGGSNTCLHVVTFPDGSTASNEEPSFSGETDSMGSKTWLSASTTKVSALEAIAICEEQGGRLPTLEEFVQANNDDVSGFIVTKLNPYSIPNGFHNEYAYYIDYHEEVYGYERYLVLPFLGSTSGKANDFLDVKNTTLASSSYSKVAEQQGNGAYVRCVKD